MPALAVHPGDGVPLLAVPVGTGQRRNRACVVKEGVRVGKVGPEVELVGDVGFAVPVRVDVDGVADVVAELIKVGATCRTLQRDVVGDQRDGARPVRADERVYVGAVGNGVFRNLGRLAMR